MTPTKTILRIKLSKGEDGTDETIAAMTAIAHDAQDSRIVQAVAKRFKDNVDTNWGRLRDIYNFLAARVVYADDEDGREQVRTPERMLIDMQTASDSKARGDCDDRATLGAALVQAMGLRAYFVVVASAAHRPFHHVFYAASWDDVPVIPFDPQEKIPPAHWPPFQRRKVYGV